MSRPSVVEVDLSAITHNVGVMAAMAPDAELCAVVKADGYGHGAVESATAALAGGAGWLAVALVDEAAELRDSGIDAPILVLSEATGSEWEVAARLGLDVTIYSSEGAEAAAEAARSQSTTLSVHLMVETGMHRVGVAPAGALSLAQWIAGAPEFDFRAVYSHLACADTDADATAQQVERFDEVCASLAEAAVLPPLQHLANSAATMLHAATRRDLTRVGISIYGLPPSPAQEGLADLRGAMSLRSRVAHLHEVAAGEGVSYGHRFVAPESTVIATVPVGYADGIDRALGLRGGEVLIGGCRCPIVGVVTMDQLMVDVGGAPVARGDEVVLIGTQGSETITATEWAQRLDTISYEVVTGLGSRLPRRYRHDTY